MEPLQKDIIATSGKIPVLSFFTGAGFLDIGFIQAGFNVVWHNENYAPFVVGFEFAMESLYGKGKQSKIQNTASITDIDAKEIIKEAFADAKLPEIFGIIGGPPCPDFSAGGKNKGRNGSKGKLSKTFVEKINALLPTFFVFENVPGLLRTKNHRGFLAELIQELATNYQLDIETLNALDFGIPQDRERIFLIGVRHEWFEKNRISYTSQKNIDWLQLLDFKRKNPFASLKANPRLIEFQEQGYRSWFPWPCDEKYINAKIKYKWPGTTKFKKRNVKKPEDIPIELTVGSLICNIEEVSKLPNGKDCFKPYSDKFNWIPEGDVHRKSFKRLHRWRYSPSAAYGNNEVHLHPTEPRRLSVREALRLQDVPDKYQLPPDMTLTDKFKTVGNGVPVRLGFVIAKSLLSFLTGDRK